MTSPEPHFPPPEKPALFYVGPVMHARFKPVPHRFTYAVFSLLVDLDRLDEANRLSRFFSVGRFNLIGFDLKPHGPNPGDDPRQHIPRMLEEAGLKEPVKKLFLLCYPRVMGFVFNPLSVYFAYGAQDRLVGVVYEVRNTFGERHSYVAPLEAGELSEAGLRQEASKLFYVSPFLDLTMRYLFRVFPPGSDKVALRILETDPEGPILSATFHGKAEPVTDRQCLRLSLMMPLMTLKVVAGIHFEALRLWLKGLRLISRPTRPPVISHAGRFLEMTWLRKTSGKTGPKETGHAN
jgi:uncharacterized protein